MDPKKILDSGLLELYALGILEEQERELIEQALTSDPLLRRALAQIEQSLFFLARANSVTPNPTIKLLLMAKVNYIERLKQGEIAASLPVLSINSKVSDFQKWLQHPDLQAPQIFQEGYVRIISQEPDKMTAIVWLTSGAPPEVHSHEYEKFLIVEGSCDITIESTIHHLKEGDYLSIPLHVTHHVIVTSAIPCKIILQRVAA